MLKPILFSAPMVRAILAGQKTMTRRVIKPQPSGNLRNSVFVNSGIEDSHGKEIKPPFYPGDIMWVRETWMPETEQRIHTGGYIYKATDNPEPDGDDKLKWRPSIFLPREAARIFLRVTDVRAERIQDITEADARREGISYWDDVGCCCSNRKFMDYSTGEFTIYEDPIRSFHTLWDSINAARGYGWDKNPWVWVYTFERITREEAMEAAT
jgi:hypothetical protein